MQNAEQANAKIDGEGGRGRNCAFFSKQNLFSVSYRTVSFAFAFVCSLTPFLLALFPYAEFYETVQLPKPLPIRDSVVHP